MVDGHAYKDHGINFEDFFCLNFHISHFLCSLKSVLRLKGMKSRSMQCVEADLHESRQDNTGLSAARRAQVRYRNAQLHHPSCLPHTFFTNASNQSLSLLPLDQQHFFSSLIQSQPQNMHFPNLNINLKPISLLLVSVAVFFLALWLVSNLQLILVIIHH